jgi:hypothetical protein
MVSYVGVRLSKLRLDIFDVFKHQECTSIEQFHLKLMESRAKSMASGQNGKPVARHVRHQKHSQPRRVCVRASWKINVFHKNCWNRKNALAVLLVQPGQFGQTGPSAQRHVESDSEAKRENVCTETTVSAKSQSLRAAQMETVLPGRIGSSGVPALKPAEKGHDSGIEFASLGMKKTAKEIPSGQILVSSEIVLFGRTGKPGPNAQNHVVSVKNCVSVFARTEKQEKTVLDQALKRKRAMRINVRSGSNGWLGQNVQALVELALKLGNDVAAEGAQKSVGQIWTRKFRATRENARNGQAGSSGMIVLFLAVAEIAAVRGFASTALIVLD